MILPRKDPDDSRRPEPRSECEGKPGAAGKSWHSNRTPAGWIVPNKERPFHKKTYIVYKQEHDCCCCSSLAMIGSVHRCGGGGGVSAHSSNRIAGKK